MQGAVSHTAPRGNPCTTRGPLLPLIGLPHNPLIPHTCHGPQSTQREPVNLSNAPPPVEPPPSPHLGPTTLTTQEGRLALLSQTLCAGTAP